MALPKQKIAVRPESQEKLERLACKLLREASAEGILPTPLERLFEVARIKNIDELPDEEAFLATLTVKARSAFKSAKQKIRGIADLRARTTYVLKDANGRRERFVQAHELGHQIIPWHKIDPTYLDDYESVGPNAKVIFEQEANSFGAEVIFQGQHFRAMVRDYHPSFDAVFELSDRHGASRQATAWRYVEEQDEAVALLQYYPSNAIDERGNYVLSLWCSVASPSFSRRFSDLVVPRLLRTGEPWAAARDLSRTCEGFDKLPIGGEETAFQWLSWWNGRALLVILRRKPMLSVVGSLIR